MSFDVQTVITQQLKYLLYYAHSYWVVLLDAQELLWRAPLQDRLQDFKGNATSFIQHWEEIHPSMNLTIQRLNGVLKLVFITHG